MGILRRILVILSLALFAQGGALPGASAVAADRDMMGMDHAAMTHAQQSAAKEKGIAALCKAHCLAVMAVLPQPAAEPHRLGRATRPAMPVAFALTAEPAPPRGPPPKV